MANKTDPTAISVHGTNPQNLIEKIVRNRIYESRYWKEHCFGLTAETLVDKAMKLKYYGGTFGGNRKPTPFLCLILKMLQIQPDREIIIEFIRNPDYKYVRILGAFYLRLVGKPVDIYDYLETYYKDFRKIRYRHDFGITVKHVDEFMEEILLKDFSCDIALPFLPKRHILEQQGLLEPRISPLADELEDMSSDSEDEQIPPSVQEPIDSTIQSNKDYVHETKRDTEMRDREKDRPDRNRDDKYSRDRDRNGDRRDRDRDYYRDRRDRDYHERYDRDRDRDRRDRDRDRDRDYYKDRDRDRDYYKDRDNKGRERSNRDRDNGRPDEKRDRGSKKGREGQDDEAMQVEEMNKLRISLGIKPLKE